MNRWPVWFIFSIVSTFALWMPMYNTRRSAFCYHVPLCLFVTRVILTETRKRFCCIRSSCLNICITPRKRAFEGSRGRARDRECREDYWNLQKSFELPNLAQKGFSITWRILILVCCKSTTHLSHHHDVYKANVGLL